MSDLLEVAPGDVLVVLQSEGVFSHLIRFAAWLQRKPHGCDHVAIVTHQDADGHWMGIEGRPGGVGACDITRFLSQAATVRSNHAQPRPNNNDELAAFLAACTKSVGIAYDWAAVVCDTFEAFRLPDLSRAVDHLWHWPANNALPGHVVCSSLAACLYSAVGWAHPNIGHERICAPADWWQWIESEGWTVKKRVEFAPERANRLVSVSSFVGAPTGVQVVETKPGSVTAADKAKAYYKEAIAVTGGATVLLNTLTPVLGHNQWFTAAAAVVTALGVALKKNERWVEGL